MGKERTFTPCKASVAKVEPDGRQEPGILLESPTWMAGVRALGPSSAALLGASAGSWIRSQDANWCL